MTKKRTFSVISYRKCEKFIEMRSKTETNFISPESSAFLIEKILKYPYNKVLRLYKKNVSLWARDEGSLWKFYTLCCFNHVESETHAGRPIPLPHRPIPLPHRPNTRVYVPIMNDDYYFRFCSDCHGDVGEIATRIGVENRRDFSPPAGTSALV